MEANITKSYDIDKSYERMDEVFEASNSKFVYKDSISSRRGVNLKWILLKCHRCIIYVYEKVYSKGGIKLNKAIGIGITDGISRYNTKCTIGALIKAYADTWKYGLPMNFNHDKTKLVGWTSLLSLYFEPNSAKLTNISMFPENDEERQEIENRIRAFQFEQFKEEEANFRNLIDKIKDHISSNYKKYLNGCVCIYDKDIIKNVIPSIIEDLDDDGLIEVSKLKEKLPGVYEKEGFIIFAHQYFRRGLSRFNSLNEPFFEKFTSISKLRNISAKIAIDFDVIGLVNTERETMEFQYWWGPKFNDTFSDIEHGVTRHKNEKYDRFLNPILHTDFWWYKQDYKSTFECEEIIDVPNLDLESEMYGCRFVHSMIDNQSDKPIHLDGAVRGYTEEGMLIRLEQKISETERNTEYTKLWRLDGDIPPAEWKKLITHYYRDNKLIGEYFNGEDKHETIKKNTMVNNEIEAIKKYVPYALNEGDGLRFSISYKEREMLKNEYDILVRTNQVFIREGNRSKYIDTEATTLFKLIKGKNINIREPMDSVKRIAFNDTVINFPILLCRGEAAIQNADVVLECIDTLCDAWIFKGNDTIISFSIEIEYENNNVLFSYAGHVKDISAWIRNENSNFPISTKKIEIWCEEFAQFLYSYPVSNNQPETFELLNEDGTLSFERVFIENDMIENTKSDEIGLLATFFIPKDDKILSEALLKNELSMGAAIHVKHSFCSNCNIEYRDCNCIKFVEEVYEKIKDAEVLGLYWTNRKA